MVMYKRPLSDLKVDGNAATGMLGDFKIWFLKEDGRWYAEDRRH